MTSLSLVYFDAGGGHRAAALALQAAIVALRPDWQVRLVHLFEVLDPQQRFRRMTGMAPEDYYNKRLARGWTIGLSQELKLLQGMIRLGHGLLVEALQAHWLRSEPDLVVSLVPNFNRALCQSLQSTLPGVPFATVMTDLADTPPHFWIEPDLPQQLICGTPHAVRQALAAGCPADRVHAVSGMLLRPDFMRDPACDRAAERLRLGFDADTPTGLVMFGGQGSSAMLKIAEALPDTPLILLCGHNARLAERLRALPGAAPRHVLGFTREVPRLMQLADFFIGKPGPGSLSEAVHMHLPVIVSHNAWTMPQERYNATWVRDNGVGLVLPSFRSIRPAVTTLLGRLDGFKAATERLENRAAVETVDRLGRILELAGRPSAAMAATPSLASAA